MKAIPLGAYVSHCAHCGVRFRTSERSFHVCSGEIKLRDVEIARLLDVLDRITDLSGFFRDGVTWPESIARKALRDIDVLASAGKRPTSAPIRGGP